MIYKTATLAALILVMRVNARSPCTSAGVRRRLEGFQGPSEQRAKEDLKTAKDDLKIANYLKTLDYQEGQTNDGSPLSLWEKDAAGIKNCSNCMEKVTGGLYGQRNRLIAQAAIKNSEHKYSELKSKLNEEEVSGCKEVLWGFGTLGLGASRKVRCWASAVYTTLFATLWTMAAAVALPSWRAHDDKVNPEGENNSQWGESNFGIQAYKDFVKETRTGDAIEFTFQHKDDVNEDVLTEALVKKFGVGEDAVGVRKPYGGKETTFEIEIKDLEEKDTILKQLGVKQDLINKSTDENTYQQTLWTEQLRDDTRDRVVMSFEKEMDGNIVEMDEAAAIDYLGLDTEKIMSLNDDQIDELEGEGWKVTGDLKIEEFMKTEDGDSILDMLGPSGEVNYDPSIENCHRELDFFFVNMFFGAMTIMLVLCLVLFCCECRKLKKAGACGNPCSGLRIQDSRV